MTQYEPTFAGGDASLRLKVWLGDDHGSAVITDPSILVAIRDCGRGDLAAGVAGLLEVGSRVVNTYGTGVDIATVKDDLRELSVGAREGVRLAFDQALGEGGPLDRALRTSADRLVNPLEEAIRKHMDPAAANTLMASIDSQRKEFDRSWSAARTAFLEEFSLQIRRIKQGDDKTLERIEGKLAQILAADAARNASAEERERGHLKGGDFEALVGNELSAMAAVAGDLVEQTTGSPGCLVSKRGGSKRGDYVSTVEGKARICLEVMDRNGVGESTAREQLIEATQNRGAQVGISIISTPDLGWMCGMPFKVLGDGLYAVVFDKNTISGWPLRLAYAIARKEAMAKATASMTVDLTRVKMIAHQIERNLSALADAKGFVKNAMTWNRKAMDELDVFEESVRTAIRQLVDQLDDEAPSTFLTAMPAAPLAAAQA